MANTANKAALSNDEPSIMKTKIISEKQRRETPKQQRQLTKQSQ
jgi:hypothetical protein